MASKPLLPLKVVLPSRTDYEPPKRDGRIKIFGEVTDKLRAQFAGEVRQVKAYFDKQRAPKQSPGVAKVQVKKEATAKSYRPTTLFSEETCPICGVGAPDEFYITTTGASLDKLAEVIVSDRTKSGDAEVSTLSSIRPWTPEDALHQRTAADLMRQIERSKSKKLRVRLFRHGDIEQNHATIDSLFQCAVTELEELDYGEGSPFYAVDKPTVKMIRAMAALPGMRSLDHFPDLRVVRKAARSIGQMSENQFAPPDASASYGVVGMIDTGTDPDNISLQAWVRDRWNFVPEGMQDNDHGTFVAGLLVHPRDLNGGDTRFPSTSSKIVDVVALDDSGEISEYDLRTVIDGALSKFPYVRVWNLSLGFDDPVCQLDSFSPLAQFLDSRSKTHNVLFVIAAGNYPTYAGHPYRKMPPQQTIGDLDRICPPADAVRGITVGGIAHKDTPKSCVNAGQPSPFARRGPAGCYLVKPELSHMAGNCDEQGQYIQTGIVSLNEGEVIAEDVGTSFSCPLISNIAAHVYNELDIPNGDASPLVTKAMLLHSALLSARPTKKTLDYLGLGCPNDGPDIIGCTESSATMMFRVPMDYDSWFFKRSFPMPASVRTSEGLIQARMYVTALHDCPVDGNFDPEYCRSNLRITIGTVDEEGGYKRGVNPVVKRVSAGPERAQVTAGFKWSPLKLFYRNITNIPANRPWRLRMWLENRSGFSTQEKQEAVVLITIADPRDQGLVYDELAREMDRLAWNTHDLQVRSRARFRTR